VWPEGLCQGKIPVTSSRIKTETYQLVAQCLTQLCHCINISYQEQINETVFSVHGPINWLPTPWTQQWRPIL